MDFRPALAGITNMVGTTGGAVGGAALGTMATPGVGTAIGGATGAAAGNAAAQWLNTKLGLQSKISGGQIAASAIMGGIPGGNLIEAPLLQAAKGAAGSLAATTVQTAMDEGKLPTVTQAAIAAGLGAAAPFAAKALDSGASATAVANKANLGATRDATLAEAKQAGYAVPPFETNPNAITNTLGSVGGKAATKQATTAQNQAVTTSLAARAIGLPENQPITLSAIRQQRAAAGQAYEAVGALSPQAAADLESLKQARFDANAQMKFYARSADPSALKAAQASGAQADQLESALENHAAIAAQTHYQNAVQSGATGPALQQAQDQAAQMYSLVPAMRQARTLIAKTYVVENALNEANGEVSAPAIGALFAKGTPLTGPLATIGKFQQAFPRYAGEASRTPAPAVSALNPVLAAGTALAGGLTHGPAGFVLGTVLPGAARAAARSVQLSPSLQSGLLSFLSRPNYGTAAPDVAGLLGRYAAMSAGQQFSGQPMPAPFYQTNPQN